MYSLNIMLGGNLLNHVHVIIRQNASLYSLLHRNDQLKHVFNTFLPAVLSVSDCLIA